MADTIAVAELPLARNAGSSRDRRTRRCSALPAERGSSDAELRRRRRPAVRPGFRTAPRRRRPRAAHRGLAWSEWLTGSRRAGLAAAAPIRAPAGPDRRPESASQPPPEDEVRVYLADVVVEVVAPGRAAGPLIRAAGISNRNRLGTDRPPWPHVARRAACDRKRRRLARVMPT